MRGKMLKKALDADSGLAYRCRYLDAGYLVPQTAPRSISRALWRAKAAEDEYAMLLDQLREKAAATVIWVRIRANCTFSPCICKSVSYHCLGRWSALRRGRAGFASSRAGILESPRAKCQFMSG